MAYKLLKKRLIPNVINHEEKNIKKFITGTNNLSRGHDFADVRKSWLFGISYSKSDS